MISAFNISSIKNQLIERKERLHQTIKFVESPDKLFSLLQQVDSALERIDKGSYGICDVCHDPIEEDRLLVDPLITLCIDHLNADQRRALEMDIELAMKIQRNLLPQNNVSLGGWEFSYHYEPAGHVSGDFCDFIKLDDGSALFVLGDVSGKGIAASLMMTHLHALIRSLISINTPVSKILQNVNRLFCESTVSSNYATMVIGRVSANGEIELCIAGHNPPLVIKQSELLELNATGIPVGLFQQAEYDVLKLGLNKGEALFLYTDGLTEAEKEKQEYGEQRVKSVLLTNAKKDSAQSILNEIIADHRNFLNNSPKQDDITAAVLRRT
jgi:sigma-B regulation protein RsbU (phosphoserine phosphatase)